MEDVRETEEIDKPVEEAWLQPRARPDLEAVLRRPTTSDFPIRSSSRPCLAVWLSGFGATRVGHVNTASVVRSALGSGLWALGCGLSRLSDGNVLLAAECRQRRTDVGLARRTARTGTRDWRLWSGEIPLLFEIRLISEPIRTVLQCPGGSPFLSTSSSESAFLILCLW